MWWRQAIVRGVGAAHAKTVMKGAVYVSKMVLVTSSVKTILIEFVLELLPVG